MFFIFWFILISQCSANISPEKMKNQKFLTVCLDSIVGSLENRRVIYAINLDLRLKSPVIRINTTKESTTWFKFEKSDVCIINSNNDNLSLHLTNLFTNPNINPRGTFLVVTNKVDSSLFSAAADYYITNLIVIEKGLQARQEIYSYAPYLRESVNNPDVEFFHLGSCVRGALDDHFNFSFNSSPRKWTNTTVQILNNMSPPYSLCPKCLTERGIEIEIFDIIAKKLEFTPNYTRKNEFMLWGEKVNGSYDHIYGDLQGRKGDMVVGAFHHKSEEEQDFDMTFSYMEDGVFWVVPKAKIVPLWKRFTLIFTITVYLTILSSFFLIVMVCHAFYRQPFLPCLLMLYQILLECSVPKIPKYFRAVVFILIPSCLVISTIFKSKLMVVMSKNSYDHQIDSLSDIVHSSLLINIDDFIASFYRDYSNSDEEHIWKNYVQCGNHSVCVERTAERQDSVTCSFQRSHEYSSHNYVDSTGYPLLHLTKILIFPLQIRLFFVKGYPLFLQIDELLLRIRSSGFVQYQYDKVAYNIQVALSKKKGTFSAEILGLEQLYVIFFVWWIGILISIFVFLMEYFIKTMNLQKHINI